ncbi:MAG: protein kinase [Anaerolineales bacterium]|nr:protein kinase [Anaerolineales bacterium]
MITHIGQLIGPYKLVEKIGTGGMAEVFKGINEQNNQVAAVKLMHAFLTTNEDLVKRFQREADVMARLNHPHIVNLYTFDTVAGETYYLAMEYVEGLTLKEQIQQLAAEKSILPLNDTITIMTEVSDALAYAHDQGIVHRDIKPGNVMIATDGKAVLMDFGIVKLVDQSVAMTMTGTLMGTPAYMAPEQALGQPGDVRADIYSMGVMLFQMVTGELPFDAETPMGIIMKHVSDPPPLPGSLNPTLPISLHEVIIKALSKDPTERFQNAPELITALQQVDLSGKEATAPTIAPILPSLTPTEPGTLPPPPFQVPPQIPHFTGRHDVLRTLIDKLTHPENGRILGIVGYGGVGKTAVAIQAVHQLRDAFPDGILWAQLNYSTPEAELVKFAAGFGQAEAVSRQYTLHQKSEFVRSILANKKVLVVLDQVEDSEQVKALIPSGPDNMTLITTRNGKMLTSLDADIIPLRTFDENESMALLRNIVGRQRLRDEQDAARQLAHLVGGLPLALSIVAGFLSDAADLSIAEYVDLLTDEQTRLANLSDWEDANRDVAASFELSYHALPLPIQRLFAHLAVFDGPDFAPHDIAVIAKIPPAQVKIGLGRLHLMSLIGSGLGERESLLPINVVDKSRYRINPLLKLFAREKLGSRYDDLRRRTADYYANMALLNQTPAGFPRLDMEWQHIVGSMRWAHQQQSWEFLLMGTQALTQNELGIVGFMDARGHWSEARELLAWGLDAANASGDPLIQARLHGRFAAFALKQADRETAVSHLTTTASLLEPLPHTLEIDRERAFLCDYRHRSALQDDAGTALAHIEQGLAHLADYEDETAVAERGYLHILRAGVLIKTGDLDNAIAAVHTGLAELPNAPTSAKVGAYINLGTAHYLQGNLNAGITYFQDAIPLAKEIGDYRRLATSTMNLGIIQEQNGQFDDAIAQYTQALRLHRGLGNADDEGSAHINLGSIYTKMGDDELAQEHLETAVSLGQQFKLTELEAFAQVGLAELAAYRQQWSAVQQAAERAATLSADGTFAFLQPIILRLQAQATLGKGDAAAAQQTIEQAIAQAEADEYLLEQGICRRVKAAILAARSDPEAKAAFEQSMALLAPQSSYEHAKTQVALAKYYLDSNGDTAVAHTLLQTAHKTFTTLQAAREQAQTNTLIQRSFSS